MAQVGRFLNDILGQHIGTIFKGQLECFAFEENLLGLLDPGS
jgi:hypothetical protein